MDIKLMDVAGFVPLQPVVFREDEPLIVTAFLLSVA
jgi:hypothetical protein